MSDDAEREATRTRQQRYRDKKRLEKEMEIAEVSLAELNSRMRQMALTAFDAVGGVEYLKKVAEKNANTFLRFVGQFVTREETINPGAFNIYVQKLTIEGAQPVRGVLASPIEGHISPQRWLESGSNGVVLDAETGDASGPGH